MRFVKRMRLADDFRGFTSFAQNDEEDDRRVLAFESQAAGSERVEIAPPEEHVGNDKVGIAGKATTSAGGSGGGANCVAGIKFGVEGSERTPLGSCWKMFPQLFELKLFASDPLLLVVVVAVVAKMWEKPTNGCSVGENMVELEGLDTVSRMTCVVDEEAKNAEGWQLNSAVLLISPQSFESMPPTFWKKLVHRISARPRVTVAPGEVEGGFTSSSWPNNSWRLPALFPLDN